MYPLFQRFVAICLLRAGPQALPASSTLLVLAVAAYVVAGAAALSPRLPLREGLMLGVVDTVLLGAFVWVLLRLRGFSARFTQTFTALVGAGTLFSLAAWPLMAWLSGAGEAVPAPGGPTLLLLVVFFWSLAVVGHILRHALAVPLAAGVLLGVAYIVLSWSVLAALFPEGT